MEMTLGEEFMNAKISWISLQSNQNFALHRNGSREHLSNSIYHQEIRFKCINKHIIYLLTNASNIYTDGLVVLPIGLEPNTLDPDSYDELVKNRELKGHWRDVRAGLTPSYEVTVGTIDTPEVQSRVPPSFVKA